MRGAYWWRVSFVMSVSETIDFSTDHSLALLEGEDRCRLLVVQGHYFCHRSIVIWHFDEEIRRSLWLDSLKQDCFVVSLRSMNWHDASTRCVQKKIISIRDSLVTLTLTCSRGRNFGECEWFVLIIIDVGFVIARLLLCMRWRWTSSSAWGSVQKWSEVFIRVNSNAHGPTDENKSRDEGDEQRWLWVYLVMKPG